LKILREEGRERNFHFGLFEFQTSQKKENVFYKRYIHIPLSFSITRTQQRLESALFDAHGCLSWFVAVYNWIGKHSDGTY